MSPRDEIWLTLDLSSPIGTLALHRSDPFPRLLLETPIGKTQDHSEALIDALHQALKTAQVTLERVDRFITTLGPGSFTGLRIGLASLKAFALVRGAPIDVLNGSEARALAWSHANSHLLSGKQKLHVFSYAAPSRFIHAEWNIDSLGRLVFESEGMKTSDEAYPTQNEPAIVLLDERTPDAWTEGKPLLHVERFPLKARFLAESLDKAKSRQTAKTPAEQIALTPHYFGDTKYS